MDKDSAIEPNKLFVGGLSWNTTSDSLKEYFTQFGEVTDSIVMSDKTADHKPRGFGFITFRDQASVGRALGKSDHILDSKKIDPKPAKVKGKGSHFPKIFIGGLSHDATEERVLKFFNEELEISPQISATSLEIKRKDNKESRGFGFMQVDSPQSVSLLVEKGPKYYIIDGKKVELKRAHDHNSSKQQGDGQQQSAIPPPNAAAAAAMMYPNGFYHPSMYNRGSQQYPQNGPAGSYITSSYGYPPPSAHRMHSTGYHHHHHNFDNYQPSSSYYGGSGQYSSSGYSGGGLQQMENYPAESTYTQTSSTFTGNDSYSNSSVMSFAYGPSTGGGYHHPHQYGNDHNGGGSPSTYSRPTGFPSQGRGTGGGGGGGGGSAIHGNNYPSYGSR